MIEDDYPEEADAMKREMELSVSKAIVKRLYEIPYPPSEEPYQHRTSNDTLRSVADELTFVETLREPPMPPSVIGELRARWSPFRTRFTVEEEKKDQDRSERKIRLLGKLARMRTPQEELLALREAKRKLDIERAEQEPEEARAERRGKLLSSLDALLAAKAAAAPQQSRTM